MATHHDRLQAARDAIDYICSRTESQMQMTVPNCPGWTVYNAAVHIGRVGVAWHSMIEATPDDPDSRVRGYADAESRGSGHDPQVLASWVTAAVDALDDDRERPCYFSMTGGHGTVALWGWHAASELGIHRLDIESAVGDPHAMSDAMAIDAIEYTATYFLPAMLKATGEPLPGLRIMVQANGVEKTEFSVGRETQSEAAVTMSGEPVDVLLALWGRPHGELDVSGSQAAFDQWHALPGMAFQFGTWD